MIGAWVQGLWSQAITDESQDTAEPSAFGATGSVAAVDPARDAADDAEPGYEQLLPPDERAQLEAACAIAEFELHSLIGDRTAPAAVVDFLRQDWVNHLTLTAVAEGEDSIVYRKAASAGVTLWLAMLACERGADAPSGILQLLQPAFDAFGRSPAEVRALGDAIIESMRALRPDPASQSEAANAMPCEIDTPKQTGATDDASGWLRTLEVGAWFMLTDETGRRQAAKLSWISPISNKMLLVDEHGARLGAFDVDEMAALARGQRLERLDPAVAPMRTAGPRAGLPAPNGLIGAALRRAVG